MSLALSDDHKALADVAADFLSRHDARGEARRNLDAADEALPAFWSALRDVGWLGLHIDERFGGSGYGVAELAVVVEQLGRTIAPGPFVPTVIASAALQAAASGAMKERLLPGLANGDTVAAIALDGDVTRSGDSITAKNVTMLSGHLADVLLVVVADDVAVLERAAAGVSIDVPTNIDPTRRAARVSFDSAPAQFIEGGARALIDHARLLFAAEATGVAHQCTIEAAGYAKVREQFGRTIATFQAVKHHCSNMLVAAELATADLWAATRAATIDADQFSSAAAMAAALALPAADLCAQLNTQVHGGIGFTWEHDAHLYYRRALALQALVDIEAAAVAVTDYHRAGVKLSRAVELPPEAEQYREAVLKVIGEVRDLDGKERVQALVASGYAVPHWPKPWGREAGAIEQLVIEQEFTAAGIKRPSYGITSWVILTLVQYATEDQLARWVLPALHQDLIWCQLFSEPDAGSDAAGVKTKATRVDGGWLVNGQKVWTSGAHEALFGLATVRTNPDVPKHSGITTMVIDMKASGVEVRPLKMQNGGSEFNEVFFNDVFVPDDDVVGPVDGGWTVARATLGNESVSIGAGDGGMTVPAELLIPAFDKHPERLGGGAARIGRYIARVQAMDAMNLRRAQRAVAGGAPGPEGNITKLMLSENAHEAAAMLTALNGPTGAFVDGSRAINGMIVLTHRALSIAGGTSEIKRNQIGERLLGLPRDPLIK